MGATLGKKREPLMIDFEFVMQNIEASKGKLPTVAAESGVKYRTLQKIADGTTKSPRIDNLRKLQSYFQQAQASWQPAPPL